MMVAEVLKLVLYVKNPSSFFYFQCNNGSNIEGT